MVNLLADFHPIVVVEQARLRALPWHAGQPTYQAGIENGWSCVELIAIVAMTASAQPGNTTGTPASIAEEILDLAESLRRLGSLKALATIRPERPPRLDRGHATDHGNVDARQFLLGSAERNDPLPVR